MPPKELTAEDKAELANLALALAHSPDRAVVAELVRKYGAKDPRIAPFVNSFADVVPGQNPTPPDPKKKVVTESDLDERFAAEEGKRRLAAEKRNKETVREELIESGRFTADTIKKLDEFMDANGYDNYEHAAILYAHENPPTARPNTGASHGWEMPTGDVLKDPRKTALMKGYQVVDELRRVRN